MVTTACGGDEASSAPDGDPGRVVLTVTSEGGFMPVEFHLDRMPRYLVTADRTLYYTGPIPMIYPGPLLPNIQVGTVDEATWSEIMTIIDDIGFSGFDERIDTDGAEMIADASTEFVTYYDDAGAHRYGAYALGLTSGPSSTDRVLLENMIQLLDQESVRGDSHAYVGEHLQVAAGLSMMEPEPGFSSVEPWPLDVSFDDMGEWLIGWRCTTVEGAEAADLFELFGSANHATLWDTGADQVSIKARPLLPGEEPCSDPMST
ncbi:hypothetical protein BH23ACT5_BH23ACT5_18340 [soil metagenome]